MEWLCQLDSARVPHSARVKGYAGYIPLRHKETDPKPTNFQ
jgi:hypothetical protein